MLSLVSQVDTTERPPPPRILEKLFRPDMEKDVAHVHRKQLLADVRVIPKEGAEYTTYTPASRQNLYAELFLMDTE